MNGSTTRTQRIIRQALTLAMSICFIAAGWLLLKPLVRPATAEAASTSTLPWTTKAIEEVAVGDLVLARDEHGTALGWKPVKEVYRRTSYHLRHLTFRDTDGHEQTFETTDEHPFWSVDDKKFVNAGDLVTGDRVVSVPQQTSSSQTPIKVDPALVQILTTTQRDEHPDGITVFNFQVEDFHTYFVAARGATGPPVLVHNADDYVTPGSLYGRQGPDEFNKSEIKRIKKDMKANGYDPNQPIEIAQVDGRNIIIDGHHRARAAGAAGISQVPVIIRQVSPEEGARLVQEAAEAAQRLGLDRRW